MVISCKVGGVNTGSCENRFVAKKEFRRLVRAFLRLHSRQEIPIGRVLRGAIKLGVPAKYALRIIRKCLRPISLGDFKERWKAARIEVESATAKESARWQSWVRNEVERARPQLSIAAFLFTAECDDPRLVRAARAAAVIVARGDFGGVDLPAVASVPVSEILKSTLRADAAAIESAEIDASRIRHYARLRQLDAENQFSEHLRSTRPLQPMRDAKPITAESTWFASEAMREGHSIATVVNAMEDRMQPMHALATTILALAEDWVFDDCGAKEVRRDVGLRRTAELNRIDRANAETLAEEVTAAYRKRLDQEATERQRLALLPCKPGCGMEKCVGDEEAGFGIWMKTKCGCWGCPRCRAYLERRWAVHFDSVLRGAAGSGAQTAFFMWVGPADDVGAALARIKYSEGRYFSVAQPGGVRLVVSDAEFRGAVSVDRDEAIRTLQAAVGNVPHMIERPVASSRAWGPKAHQRQIEGLKDMKLNAVNREFLIEFLEAVGAKVHIPEVRETPTVSDRFTFKLPRKFRSKGCWGNMLGWLAIETIPPSGDLRKPPPTFSPNEPLPEDQDDSYEKDGSEEIAPPTTTERSGRGAVSNRRRDQLQGAGTAGGLRL